MSMTKVEAAEVVRRKWDAQGHCDSCGWHAAIYEVEPITIDDSELKDGVVWFPCRSKDVDGSDHRGVRIRLS